MDKTYTYVPGAEFPYQYKYEHMAVTADCVMLTWEDDTLKVLLIQRGGEPYKGEWAFPGGFLRMNETAMEGALRELREETALEPSAIKELGVFSDLDRDPRERVITIAYYAIVKPGAVVGGDDAAAAAWFPVDELPPLAFDHDKIFRAALERLRRDIYFEPVGFDLLDEEFTFPELKKLYEAILGKKFDRANFQRKILASGILEKVEEEDEELLEFHNVSYDSCIQIGGNEMGGDAYRRVPTDRPSRRRKEMPVEEAVESSGSQPKPKRKPGRAANRFRLNRKKYDEMKEDGGKIEF